MRMGCSAARTNNALERLNRGIRRRTRVVGTFPDGNSALIPMTARLKYVAPRAVGLEANPSFGLASFPFTGFEYGRSL